MQGIIWDQITYLSTERGPAERATFLVQNTTPASPVGGSVPPGRAFTQWLLPGEWKVSWHLCFCLGSIRGMYPENRHFIEKFFPEIFFSVYMTLLSLPVPVFSPKVTSTIRVKVCHQLRTLLTNLQCSEHHTSCNDMVHNRPAIVCLLLQALSILPLPHTTFSWRTTHFIQLLVLAGKNCQRRRSRI